MKFFTGERSSEWGASSSSPLTEMRRVGSRERKKTGRVTKGTAINCDCYRRGGGKRALKKGGSALLPVLLMFCYTMSSTIVTIAQRRARKGWTDKWMERRNKIWDDLGKWLMDEENLPATIWAMGGLEMGTDDGGVIRQRQPWRRRRQRQGQP